MTLMRTTWLCLAIASLWLAGICGPAQAQNLFAPAVKVNEKTVTKYEVSQRAKFMELLGAPEADHAEALEALITDRLHSQAATAAGINPSEQEVQTGMDEFAARTKMNTKEFIQELNKSGVARETFRDFVKSGLAWRQLVGAKFAARANITEAEVDRAIAQSSAKGGLRVLLNEIILPAHTPEATAASEKRAKIIGRIRSFSAFSAQAREFSASASRQNDGELPWMPMANLPAHIRSQIMALSPGQVSEPIPITNGIVLFQLRSIQETAAPVQAGLAVEYATYLIKGGRSQAALDQAAHIKAQINTCDDLYGINKGQDASLLEITSQAIRDIPKGLALELAKLDAGETSFNLTRDNGQTLVFLMLCGRTPKSAQNASRDTVRAQLQNKRLALYADGYLAELRANATIIYP